MRRQAARHLADARRAARGALLLLPAAAHAGTPLTPEFDLLMQYMHASTPTRCAAPVLLVLDLQPRFNCGSAGGWLGYACVPEGTGLVCDVAIHADGRDVYWRTAGSLAMEVWGSCAAAATDAWVPPDGAAPRLAEVQCSTVVRIPDGECRTFDAHYAYTWTGEPAPPPAGNRRWLDFCNPSG